MRISDWSSDVCSSDLLRDAPSGCSPDRAPQDEVKLSWQHEPRWHQERTSCRGAPPRALGGRLGARTAAHQPLERADAMQTRSIIVVCIILSFTAGLAVASFAGFRAFLPGLLDGARIKVLITVPGCAVSVVIAFPAALPRIYAG